MALQQDDISQLQPHLQRFAFSLTRDHDQARDLVQDCVLRALEKEHLFQAGSDMRRWMFALMRNLFLDGKRREKTRLRYADELAEQYQSVQPAQQFNRQYLRDTLVAVDRLGNSERQAVRMLCVQGLSLAEAARRDGVPIGTLKSRLSRARSRLRRMMNEESDRGRGAPAQSSGSIAR